ncbi:HNH endonuclease [Flexibacterium corallicola]|uniref:HNH endonuclease n=1 Tax=Flexibacterium corallicola TaxID=3037259 RepID=UPI00286F8C1E|nr:HNH endonuclease signature motif containing protein [Pseudovibrio sp. M1P-2-3]
MADNRSAAAKEYRRWYNTKRWHRLRQKALVRDGYRCQKTGEILSGKKPEPNSPIADHIIPHKGDPKLFWDLDNIQTVSKAYHDKQKQLQEKRGYSTDCDDEGWPVDPAHPANRGRQGR